MNEKDRIALVAWSAVAEPADTTAGALVAALGPSEALAFVRKGVDDLAGSTSMLRGVFSAEDAQTVVKAHERWASRLELADSPHARRVEAVGGRVVTRLDEEWPVPLNDLGFATPFALYVRGGSIGSAWERSVAIVGARAATHYGTHCAYEIASGCVAAGVTVVSGGAYGIDAQAHLAAIHGAGNTISIMAGGVDRLYPAGNEAALRSVMEHGAVVSEVPPGFAPHRSRFLSRNRLIAASTATVVVEAAHRSGAISTARHAANLLRPVGAVPGPVTSPSSAGCHGLVRDGLAVLVTTAQEAIELVVPASELAELNAADAGSGGTGSGGTGSGGAGARAGAGAGAGSGGAGAAAPLEFATSEERKVFDSLSSRPRLLGAIAARSGLGVAEAAGALGGLELAGLARSQEGGWSKVPSRRA